MIVIMPTESKTPTCPNCNKNEDKVDTCKHCGYVYPEEKSTPGEIMGGLFFLCLIVWFIITIFLWLMNGDIPLFEIIRHQWHWLKSLRIY